MSYTILNFKSDDSSINDWQYINFKIENQFIMKQIIDTKLQQMGMVQ